MTFLFILLILFLCCENSGVFNFFKDQVFRCLFQVLKFVNSSAAKICFCNIEKARNKYESVHALEFITLTFFFRSLELENVGVDFKIAGREFDFQFCCFKFRDGSRPFEPWVHFDLCWCSCSDNLIFIYREFPLKGLQR